MPRDDTLRISPDAYSTLKLLDTPRIALDVQAFLLDAQARNLSEGTLRYYRQKLLPLMAFLHGLGVRQAEEVTTAHMRLWIIHLQDTGHNPGGVHAFYRAAKAFLSWLVQEEVLDESPMRRIKAPRVPREVLPPVTIEEVQAMLAACDSRTQLGARDRAVILCLMDTGCRATEFTSLTYDDFDFRTGAVYVRAGKGRKPRITFLGAKSRRELLRYLRFRGDLTPSTPMFATESGQPLSYTGLRDIVRRRARDAGVPAPTLHAFRRAFALAMLRNGADVYSLQRLMGHASLAVLRQYLAQTEEDLRRAHERAGPVDHLLA